MLRARSFGVGVCLLLIAGVATAETPFGTLKSQFRKALKSSDAKERARGFDLLRKSDDPRVLEEILYGVKKVASETVKIQSEQEAAQELFANLQNKMEKATAKFKRSRRSPNDIATFNKTERRLSKERDEARRSLKGLENTYTRNRALLQQAASVMGEVLAKLGDEAFEDALVLLDEEWLSSKRDPDGPTRWFDAMGDVTRTRASQAIHHVLDDAERPIAVRVAAMDTLAARMDGAVYGKALATLDYPPASFPLTTAGIAALKRFHERRAIAPLITFLDRKDLGRLREDAHGALVSLTGEKHGPYADPWRRWWVDNENVFKMPEAPVKRALGGQAEGVTFYGIHTFSDRVLFIVDISASMDWALGGERGAPGGEKAKMIAARKELVGAVFNLNEGDRFNVILFNHEVIPWRSKNVVSSETTNNQLKRWVEEMQPSGLTNIHDALEQGFRVATATTGRPDLDTIFFLTDGKPTAGKIQDTQQILQAVAEWNEVAHIRVHVIAIGGDDDIDETFLKRIAEIGNGEYVRRK